MQAGPSQTSAQPAKLRESKRKRTPVTQSLRWTSRSNSRYALRSKHCKGSCSVCKRARTISSAVKAKPKPTPSCCICLNTANKRAVFKKMKCGHKFHNKCIENWLKRSDSCPMCRTHLANRVLHATLRRPDSETRMRVILYPRMGEPEDVLSPSLYQSIQNMQLMDGLVLVIRSFGNALSQWDIEQARSSPAP